MTILKHLATQEAFESHFEELKRYQDTKESPSQRDVHQTIFGSLFILKLYGLFGDLPVKFGITPEPNGSGRKVTVNNTKTLKGHSAEGEHAMKHYFLGLENLYYDKVVPRRKNEIDAKKLISACYVYFRSEALTVNDAFEIGEILCAMELQNLATLGLKNEASRKAAKPSRENNFKHKKLERERRLVELWKLVHKESPIHGASNKSAASKIHKMVLLNLYPSLLHGGKVLSEDQISRKLGELRRSGKLKVN